MAVLKITLKYLYNPNLGGNLSDGGVEDARSDWPPPLQPTPTAAVQWAKHGSQACPGRHRADLAECAQYFNGGGAATTRSGAAATGK